MKELFSLGKIYLSDFLEKDAKPTKGMDDLTLVMDDDGAVRLSHYNEQKIMFGKYWYRSGTNESMKEGLKDIVDSITKVYKLKTSDIWLDIACNDGTLLSYVPNNLFKIGIDPAENSFVKESENRADYIIQDYFTADVYKKATFQFAKAKVITAIAMFYDIEHRETFLNDINEVLDDNGLLVLQMSYTPLMLQQMAFDNICHEHYYYYSLFNIKNLLERNGFKIMDCQVNDINGGSFRLFIMKQEGNENLFASQPHRDVCNVRINSLLHYEDALGLDEIRTWEKFYYQIVQLRNKITRFIKQEKAKGKTIWAYGASTKGNTLLQYFGLDNTIIDAIADRSPYKWGLKTVGTNIPIESEQTMRLKHPDYLLILPWHFITEFKEREKDYLNKGGKFIVPCPTLQIIGNE